MNKEEKIKESKAIKKKPVKGELELTKETIKNYISPKASEKEITLFLNQCVMWNLNPFKREIYLIKYSEKDPAQFVIGFESFLKRAERTKKLDGWEWGTEGEPKKPGFKAWIRIYRKGWKYPFYHEVFWEEYAQYKTDYRTGKKVLTRFWNEKPSTMLKKVVASQGFKFCFSDELGGMPYITEEMPIDIERLPKKTISATPKQAKPSKAEEKEVIEAEVVEEEEETKEEEELEEKESPSKATDKEIAENIAYKVQEDFKLRFSDWRKEYQAFKKFLLGFQKTRKPPRCFVQINEHKYISMSLGVGSDLEVMWENFPFTITKWTEHEKLKREKEEDEIPF